MGERWYDEPDLLEEEDQMQTHKRTWILPSLILASIVVAVFEVVKVLN